MRNRTTTRIFWLLSAVLVVNTMAYGQSQRPLFQPITIQPGKETPNPNPTPLVTKTSSTRPINAPETSVPAAAAPVPLAYRRTPYSILQSIPIPGESGVLIESENGELVLDSMADVPLNPASNVKVSTTYAVLRTFGPNYRFATGVWTDGTVDPETNTLVGNLYVSGRDPIFNYEHALSIADELNRMGIGKVQGDIIVTPNFSMSYNASSNSSGSSLQNTMNPGKRSSAARISWSKYRVASGKSMTTNPNPTVEIAGGTRVDSIPANAHLLFNHESAPLREIVKTMMSYSNNFLAERLGGMVGGSAAVERVVRRDAGVSEYEYNISTCSGLGVNRVSPRAQMRLLRTLRNMLAQNRLTFADIMPVAGMDDGTLSHRFIDGMEPGSVVGKTGTLNQTDRGVSSLSGEISTRKGKYLFVIFNQRGGVNGFRSFQNSFVSLVQNLLGGPVAMRYSPVSMDTRLAKSRIVRPNEKYSGLYDD